MSCLLLVESFSFICLFVYLVGFCDTCPSNLWCSYRTVSLVEFGGIV